MKRTVVYIIGALGVLTLVAYMVLLVPWIQALVSPGTLNAVLLFGTTVTLVMVVYSFFDSSSRGRGRK